MIGRPQRSLVRSILPLFAFIAALSIATPGWAHKEHKTKQEAAKIAAQRAASGTTGEATPMTYDPEMRDHAGTEGTGDARERSQTFLGRLLDWLGRLHPMLVHFPIAFIPAALFTAIAGRRRPGFAKPVQFLVVAAGVTAPFAVLSGWLSAGFSLGFDDWLTQSHRWLGTGVAIAAFALGVFAFKHPEQDRATGMIVGLSILTAAIMVQGWLGGALVHGLDHLNW